MQVLAGDVTARQLVKELQKFHAFPPNRWVFIPELRIGTGYGRDNEQRLDGWAISCWKNTTMNNVRRAFEIKVAASDVVHELRDPDKRWMAYALSNEFYFVAPAGLIDPRKLTRDDGLIEWDGTKLTIKKAPRVREAMPPKWRFVAALARRIVKEEYGKNNSAAERLETADVHA